MFSRLRLTGRFRTLHAQAILRIVLPLALIILGLFVAGMYAYNRIVTSLIIERHRQLAGIAGVSVSEVLEGHANVLETLASKQRLQSPSSEQRAEVLREVEEVFGLFDGGIFILNEQGAVITVSGDSPISSLSDSSLFEIFQSVHDQLAPSFSNVLYSEETNDALVLAAVPLFDAEDQFAGAMIGAIDLRSTSISKPIWNLPIGEDGFAYLVDREGIIIAHPDSNQIGANYGDRASVRKVMARESGGMLVKQSTGELLVVGYVPIELTGWGLIVQESWDSSTEPIGLFGVLVMAVGLAMIILVIILSWKGFARIATPIQALHDQTEKLAQGGNIEAMPKVGIDEIDALERAFLKMADQISSYRSGLHRYVGAITKSQEEERRRIARELHDDTVQSLLAVSRRLELYQSSEDAPQRRKRLAELQDMINQTLVGIRRISRDLRPLMLEDLGLIPALQTLVRAARQGQGAVPHARFKTIGRQIPLNPEQEMAIYRITQEALENIRKHARATGVQVELSFDPGMVVLEIVDDGLGFEMPPSLTDFAQRDCFGLVGIQERALAVNGTLLIYSSPGVGTRLSVTIPVSNSDTILEGLV
jgi:signal transduction histidine kinase